MCHFDSVECNAPVIWVWYIAQNTALKRLKLTSKSILRPLLILPWSPLYTCITLQNISIIGRTNWEVHQKHTTSPSHCQRISCLMKGRVITFKFLSAFHYSMASGSKGCCINLIHKKLKAIKRTFHIFDNINNYFSLY